MKRKGRKAIVRIWPEALAALAGMKQQFPQIDRYGLNEALISSAILFLHEHARFGLGKTNGLRGWRPLLQAQGQQPLSRPSSPRLRLV